MRGSVLNTVLLSWILALRLRPWPRLTPFDFPFDDGKKALQPLNLVLDISQNRFPARSFFHRFFPCAFLNFSYNSSHNVWLLTNTVKLSIKPSRTCRLEFSNVIF